MSRRIFHHKQTLFLCAAISGMFAFLAAAVWLPDVVSAVTRQKMTITLVCLAAAFGCAVAVERILDGERAFRGKAMILAVEFLVLSLVSAPFA